MVTADMELAGGQAAPSGVLLAGACRPGAPWGRRIVTGRSVPSRIGRRGAHQSSKTRAFHVARRRAGRGVPQTVAQGAEPADGAVEFSGLGREQVPIDRRAAVRCEHARDLVQGEPGGAPQRDERQPLYHARIEPAPQATSSDR